jgi:hypothetical protein
MSRAGWQTRRRAAVTHRLLETYEPIFCFLSARRYSSRKLFRYCSRECMSILPDVRLFNAGPVASRVSSRIWGTTSRVSHTRRSPHSSQRSANSVAHARQGRERPLYQSNHQAERNPIGRLMVAFAPGMLSTITVDSTVSFALACRARSPSYAYSK